MKNEEFDKLIKGKLEHFEMSPPPNMFQKIQAGMLEEKPKKRTLLFLPFLKYGSAAAVAFLMGMAVMSIMYNSKEEGNANTELAITNTVFSKENSANLVEENISQDNSQKDPSILNTNTSVLNKSLNKDEGKKPAANSSALLSTNLAHVSNISFSKGSNLKDPNTASTNLSNMKVYSLYSLDSRNPEEITMAKVETDAEFNRFNLSKSRTPYMGLWFGPQFSFQSRFIGGQALLGNGFGLDFGYNFNDVLGIQTGLHYSMLSKEFKVEQLDGKYKYELYSLSRIYLPLSVKFKHSYFARGVERPVSFNTYFGADYSHLTAISKHEAGMHIGMEYDIFLRPEMMISLGFRAGAGHIFNYQGESTYLQNVNSKKLNYTLGIYTALRFTAKKD